MRKYREGTERKPIEIICNCCGRRLAFADGIPSEEACSVAVRWGYFSKKDGEHHSFDLCEECYDKLIKSFEVPPEIELQTEIF